ncbi:MAG: hypothetical protein K8R21_13260 [Leptospira sp.]|nr:hypothetical protein [Leptospira sp.]
MKFYFLIILLFISLRLNSQNVTPTEKDLAENPTGTSGESASPNVAYNEQISCFPQNCVRIDFDDKDKAGDQLKEYISQDAGKILIDLRRKKLKLGDDDLEDIRDYLRETLKRDGKVSVEPYYMGVRALGIDFPFFKDLGGVGWNVYKRIRNLIKFRKMKNYHAKVLYHPVNSRVMLIFFANRSYGDVCDTIYSNCTEIEYVDDDSFDLILSNALKESLETKRSVKINFRQEKANLPDTKLDLENLKNINRSVRLYKWFIAAKETEKRSTKKERFIPAISTLVSVVDYSLSAYDYIQKYIMYSPARKMKAEVNYSGKEAGGQIQSVVFTAIETEPEKAEKTDEK